MLFFYFFFASFCFFYLVCMELVFMCLASLTPYLWREWVRVVDVIIEKLERTSMVDFYTNCFFSLTLLCIFCLFLFLLNCLGVYIFWFDFFVVSEEWVQTLYYYIRMCVVYGGIVLLFESLNFFNIRCLLFLVFVYRFFLNITIYLMCELNQIYFVILAIN